MGGNLKTHRQVYTGVSRAEADEMLMGKPGSHFLAEEGRWMIRTTLTVGSFDLCIVYEGQPTHHLVDPTDGGAFTVDHKRLGKEVTTLDGVVDALCDIRGLEGWPIALDRSQQLTALPYNVGVSAAVFFLLNLGGLDVRVLEV